MMKDAATVSPKPRHKLLLAFMGSSLSTCQLTMSLSRELLEAIAHPLYHVRFPLRRFGFCSYPLGLRKRSATNKPRQINMATQSISAAPKTIRSPMLSTSAILMANFSTNKIIKVSAGLRWLDEVVRVKTGSLQAPDDRQAVSLDMCVRRRGSPVVRPRPGDKRTRRYRESPGIP